MYLEYTDFYAEKNEMNPPCDFSKLLEFSVMDTRSPK